MHETSERWRTWLDEQTALSGLKVKRVPYSECRGWSRREGGFVSETGGFFTVKGLVAEPKSSAAHAFSAAMIDQPEIGRLGLVRPAGESVEWLLQAKTEPGNVRATQIAPSIQATPSNYKRLHGGRPTEFLDEFLRPQAGLSDGFHSEQGTRFIWKFNRNQVVALPGGADPAPHRRDTWRWAAAGELRAMLGESYMVNTDARSVIATAPWSLLCAGRILFQSPCLIRSYSRKRNLAPPHGGRRNAAMAWRLEPLDALPGRTLSPDALLREDGGAEVVFCHTCVTGREVDSWFQPFLTDSAMADCALAVRLVDGAAQVFARVYAEPGFGGRAEFGPTLNSAFASPDALNAWFEEGAQELLAIEQSDEGGRFMRTRVRYRLALVDADGPTLTPHGQWLTLDELESACRTSGVCNNELRTLASLVLSQQFDDACLELG